MKVKCLNSSSDGNCFVLTDDEDKMLLLDCGVTIKTIKQGIDFDVSDLLGAICTHAHKDHSLAVDDIKKMGKQVFTPYTRKDDAKRVVSRFGNFIVDAFLQDDADGRLLHTNADGSPCKCYGFFIRHELRPDWNLLYITDTEYCRYTFPNLKNLIIGTNYETEKLMNSGFDDSRVNHVLYGHMALETVIKMLNTNEPANNVILAHLSHENANPEYFKGEAEKAVSCNVYVATKGLDINL